MLQLWGMTKEIQKKVKRKCEENTVQKNTVEKTDSDIAINMSERELQEIPIRIVPAVCIQVTRLSSS